MPKRSLLLLLAVMLVCPLAARADKLTVGFWDASQGINTPVTTLASVTAPITTTGPIIQLLPQQQGQPLFVGRSGFGFDQIIAMASSPPLAPDVATRRPLHLIWGLPMRPAANSARTRRERSPATCVPSLSDCKSMAMFGWKPSRTSAFGSTLR